MFILVIDYCSFFCGPKSFLDVYYGGHLPVEVCRGSIGRISLTIPYTSLFSQPVVITIQVGLQSFHYSQLVISHLIVLNYKFWYIKFCWACIQAPKLTKIKSVTEITSHH